MQIYVDIKFICHDCKRCAPTDSLVWVKQYEFISITDVFKHLQEYPDHYITAEGEA